MTETPADSAPTILYSYSHKDERLKDSLDAHLSSMLREGAIRSWHDRKVSPGADWAKEIDQQVARADIVVALVSADFIASNYCWGVELARALERHDRAEAVVVPVIVRPVDWRNTPLGRLQALPRDGRAVTTWANRDEAWTDVAKGLRAVVRAFHERASGTGTVAPEGRRSGGQAPIAFAHLNVTDEKEPRWKEFDHQAADCPFGAACDRYVHLDDFVYDADLFLDVVVLNGSRSPVVLSAVGAEVLDVVQIMYVYGHPQPAKLSRATDEYVLEMPDLRSELPTPARPWARESASPLSVNRQVWVRLPDPVYLPARAPYRYLLRFKDYQRNVPNHARLRLLAEAGGEVARSQVLHAFTW